MMKTKLIIGISIAVGVAASVFLAGCACTRIKQLSGAEFQKQAGQCEQMNSFNWTSYIGVSQQRAYLEYGYPALVGSGMRTTVYWTPLADLPSNVVRQLRTGSPPWTNWMDKAK
jgi:hypothetical protein